MTTGFTILWGGSGQTLSVPAVRADMFPMGAQHWRGVRDVAAFLWLVQDVLSDDGIDSLTAEHGFACERIRVLRSVANWGIAPDGQKPPVANFVLREMEADSVVTFLPKLCGQMEQVSRRPGCLGTILSAERGAPHHLLGITYWQDEKSFAQYMYWASKHPWKYTVNPITSNVPLRLLARRTESTATED